ncbi:MAG: organomercurial lyase, partial [Deferrisomatales bacterium]|nr:organomercurial lyase [Deferrisomatales bacterium]
TGVHHGLESMFSMGRNAHLIVLADGGAVQGAYPFTTARTPHRVTLRGHTLNAMCALDALAIAPMFRADTVIESACEVSREPLRIEQAGDRLVGASPTPGMHLGIQWGAKEGVAAHSL